MDSCSTDWTWSKAYFFSIISSNCNKCLFCLASIMLCIFVNFMTHRRDILCPINFYLCSFQLDTPHMISCKPIFVGPTTYRKYYKHWDRKTWANNADLDLGVVWFGSAMFAIPPVFFDSSKETSFKSRISALVLKLSQFLRFYGFSNFQKSI